MHHLLLLLTVALAAVFFFILPWPLNLILYCPIFIGAAIAYGKALQAQRLPQQTRERAMVGKVARVIRTENRSLEVIYGGELWQAVCAEPVKEGQNVLIQRVDGLTLHVVTLPQHHPDDGRQFAKGTTNANGGDAESGLALTSRDSLLELLVFLFLILPSMALSFLAAKQGSLGFAIVAVATILRDLALVSLILLFLRKNRESPRRIGWRFDHIWQEIGLGVALFPPFFFVTSLVEGALLASGLHEPPAPLPALQATGGVGHALLGVVLVAIVAFAEETMFRGYLIRRFLDISSSPGVAVILSAFIFSLGHGYEGSAGVATVGFMGMVFALVYLWRNSLTAAMVMHFLQDFLGIILVPLASGS
jgi:membrane protease YdiL (CAAX protease family)/membrane protein implicated in regulation of membrane protease activity